MTNRDPNPTPVEFGDGQDENGRSFAVVYQCQVKWDDLPRTLHEQVRYCTNCEQHVFAVRDRKGFEQAVAAGKCVMVETKSAGLLLGGPAITDYCAPGKRLMWD